MAAQLVNACESRSSTRSVLVEKTYQTWGECTEVRTFVLNQSSWYRLSNLGRGKGQHQPRWKLCAQKCLSDIQKIDSRQTQEWNQLEYRQTFIIHQKAYKSRNTKPIRDELWATIAIIECQQMTIKLKYEYRAPSNKVRDWRYASYDALKQMKRLPENIQTYMRETLDLWELPYRRSMMAFNERFLCPWEAVVKQCLDQLSRQCRASQINK